MNAPRSPVSPAEFFEAIARRYDRTYALDTASTRARMKRILAELAPRSRVLDLGVGTGRELSALQDAGHAPTGLDASPTMIALCERRARPVPLVLADLWKPLPFPDRSFDACIALHGTLAHPPPVEEEVEGAAAEGPYESLVRELARVVRPGGAFIAEVPAPSLLAHLEASPIVTPEMTLRPLARDRILHEDHVAGVSVAACILPASRWEALLAPAFEVTIEPLFALELLVVAHRR